MTIFCDWHSSLVKVSNGTHLKCAEWPLREKPEPLHVGVWIVLTTGCTHFKYSVHFGLDIVLNIGKPYKKNQSYRCIVIQSTNNNNPKALGETQPNGKCSWYIQQRSRFRVATKGQDHYIVINHLRVRWKPVTSTTRQTKCLFHMLFDTVSRIQIVKNPTFLLESKGSLSLNDDMNRAKLDWNLLVFFW